MKTSYNSYFELSCSLYDCAPVIWEFWYNFLHQGIHYKWNLMIGLYENFSSDVIYLVEQKLWWWKLELVIFLDIVFFSHMTHVIRTTNLHKLSYILRTRVCSLKCFRVLLQEIYSKYLFPKVELMSSLLMYQNSCDYFKLSRHSVLFKCFSMLRFNTGRHGITSGWQRRLAVALTQRTILWQLIKTRVK